MIGLDTNVVIRYLTQDDPDQTVVANQLIDSLDESEPGFISIAAVVEIGWVLTRAYRLERGDLADVFDRLLSSRELEIQHSECVRAAVASLRGGGDLADAIIADLGRRAGCQRTMTFDRRAAARSGMVLLDADVS